MSGFFIILAGAAMLITLGVLFTGIFSMVRGGEYNKRNANKFMRWRIIAQGVALLLFAIAMMLDKQ